MNNLNIRQTKILEIIKLQQNIGLKKILEQLNQKVSVITISRDLSKLVKFEYLQRNGKGPATRYSLLPKTL